MAPSFPHPSQGMVLWSTGSTPSGLRQRGYHPLRRAFPDRLDFTGEEAAGSSTLHPPLVSQRGSVWTLPLSLAATEGIPFWFLFLPLLRRFSSGGSRSLEGAP